MSYFAVSIYLILICKFKEITALISLYKTSWKIFGMRTPPQRLGLQKLPQVYWIEHFPVAKTWKMVAKEFKGIVIMTWNVILVSSNTQIKKWLCVESYLAESWFILSDHNLFFQQDFIVVTTTVWKWMLIMTVFSCWVNLWKNGFNMIWWNRIVVHRFLMKPMTNYLKRVISFLDVFIKLIVLVK